MEIRRQGEREPDQPFSDAPPDAEFIRMEQGLHIRAGRKGIGFPGTVSVQRKKK